MGGYGWIQCNDGSGSVFVHFSDINGEGFRTLEAGEAVRFKMVATDISVKSKKASASKRTNSTRRAPAKKTTAKKAPAKSAKKMSSKKAPVRKAGKAAKRSRSRK